MNCRRTIFKLRWSWGIIWVLAALVSCGPPKDHKRKYRKAWEEIVESDTWQRSLATSGTGATAVREVEEAELVAHLEAGTSEDPEAATSVFEQRYNKLLARAYFTLIRQAESVDTKIRSDYERLVAENENTQNVNWEQLAIAARRYYAHKAMLDGLKSWKAFEEYGSDDLDFFRAEQYAAVYELNQAGSSDKAIVDFLLVRLADLYHLEGEESD